MHRRMVNLQPLSPTVIIVRARHAGATTMTDGSRSSAIVVCRRRFEMSRFRPTEPSALVRIWRGIGCNALRLARGCRQRRGGDGTRSAATSPRSFVAPRCGTSATWGAGRTRQPW
jgi:hypothetical protein